MNLTGRDIDLLRSAKQLTEWNGPIFFMFYGPKNGYFENLTVFKNFWFDENSFPSPQIALPPFVWLAKKRKFEINIDSAIYEAYDDYNSTLKGYHIGSFSRLRDEKGLRKFIKEWNTKQRMSPVYDWDLNRVLVLDKNAFQELIK